MNDKIKVVKDETLSNRVDEDGYRYYEPRYVIIDEGTGSILDNAQGWGYKTIQGAYKAWTYKNKVKNPKQHEKKIRAKVKGFVSNHKEIFRELQDVIWYSAKDGEKLTEKDIKDFLKEKGIEDLPFTINQLLKNW